MRTEPALAEHCGIVTFQHLAAALCVSNRPRQKNRTMCSCRSIDLEITILRLAPWAWILRSCIELLRFTIQPRTYLFKLRSILDPRGRKRDFRGFLHAFMQHIEALYRDSACKFGAIAKYLASILVYNFYPKQYVAGDEQFVRRFARHLRSRPWFVAG